MKTMTDVAIIGGGVVGLSCALAMAERGFDVCLTNRDPLTADTDAPDLRVYAINGASMQLLQALGVWQNLPKDRLSPYRTMDVWDGENGESIAFDARLVAQPFLGHIVEESVLRAGLLAKMAVTPRIRSFSDAEVTHIRCEPDYAHLKTEKQDIRARLVMIADGRESPTRTMLGVGATTWSYHQHALITQVETEKPHGECARQVFRTNGTLAFLPLCDPHQSSIVWSSSPQHTDMLSGLTNAELSEALETAFEHKSGKVRVIRERRSFPLIMRHTHAYSGTRWILLGDCAHTIHPLAGLGLNLGLADVSTWLAEMDSHPGELWSARMAGSYQRKRKYAVWQTILVMEGLKTLFGNPVVSPLRALGLRACNHLEPLKRWFVEHASGESAMR